MREKGPKSHVRIRVDVKDDHKEPPGFQRDPLNSESVIRACSLCDGASESTFRLLLDGCTLTQAERGEILWSAGTEARFFAIVAVGLVRLARRAPRAQEVVVELAGPGAVAGILASLSTGPYPLTSTAVIPTWYLKVPTNLWRKAMAQDPVLFESAMAQLRRRLLESYDFLGGMATCAVESRLAFALLYVYEVLRSPSLEADPTLPISRQCLADIATTSVESVIRTTTKWQRRGWIKAGYRTITIVDFQSLNSLLR